MSLINIGEPNNLDLHLHYPPAVVTDWSPVPTEVYNALDQLADRVTPASETDIDIWQSANALDNNAARNFIPNGFVAGYNNVYPTPLTTWDAVTGIISFGKSGTYRITAFVQFEPNATGNRYVYLHFIRAASGLNSVISGSTKTALSGIPTEINIAADFYAVPGDTAYIEIYQNSGILLQQGGHVSIMYSHA